MYKWHDSYVEKTANPSPPSSSPPSTSARQTNSSVILTHPTRPCPLPWIACYPAVFCVHSCLSGSNTVFSSNSSARFHTRHKTCTRTQTFSTASRPYCDENMHVSSSYLDSVLVYSQVFVLPHTTHPLPMTGPRTMDDLPAPPSTKFTSPLFSLNAAVHHRRLSTMICLCIPFCSLSLFLAVIRLFRLRFSSIEHSPIRHPCMI